MRPAKRSPVDALWLEFCVAKQVSTGQGQVFLPMYAGGPGGAFKAQELGLAFDHGPSVFSTAAGLAYKNRERQRTFEKSQLPPTPRTRRRSAKGKTMRGEANYMRELRRTSPKTRQRQLRRRAKAAGVVVRDGALVRRAAAE